jgi:peptidoglycan biosynthesis protein MviN/MurJ (putative lipid II flippase)
MLTFVFFSTLINIGLNLYFIPTYGAEAAMFVAMFTQACFGICLWVYCKKNWNIEPARSVIIRLAILTIILYISALIVKSLFSNPLLHGVLLFITWVISVLILRLFSFKWFQEIQTN